MFHMSKSIQHGQLKTLNKTNKYLCKDFVRLAKGLCLLEHVIVGNAKGV